MSWNWDQIAPYPNVVLPFYTWDLGHNGDGRVLADPDHIPQATALSFN